MFCTACGHSMASADRFCARCGKGVKPLSEGAASSEYAPRRLFRLNYDKQIGGVCAGLARYVDIDVTLVRILVVAGAIFSGGIVILAYLFAWAIMPVDYGVRPSPMPAPPPPPNPGPAASEQPAV